MKNYNQLTTRNEKRGRETHLEVMKTLDLRPVPPRESSQSLNNDIIHLLLLPDLLALLVQHIKLEVPFRLFVVPLGRSEAMSVAEEAVELVFFGDVLEVEEDLGTGGVELGPGVLSTCSVG